MVKKKGLWIILVVLVLIGTGVFVITRRNTPAQARSTGVVSQNATAYIGSLTISASGTGTVVAAEEASVGFYGEGTIGELLVSVGDQVAAGDVLAYQSNTQSLELAVTNAELQLELAESALQSIYDNYDTDLADAELAVVSAQITLNAAETARIQLDYARCDEDIVTNYYGTYLRTKENYDKLVNRQAPETEINEAKAKMNAAWVNYDYCVAARDETEIAESDANVAVANAALTSAQTRYEKLKNGVDADEVAQAQADIAAAEYNLSVAREALEGATVTAPIGGTIMSISASTGDTVEGAFITINQMTPTTLTISLDETDLNSIGVGYIVEVVFDAFENQTFTGKISMVSPGLTSMGNSGVVSAEVVLDEDSYTKVATIPIGLSASVEVIGSRAQNVILIPVEALVDLGDGKYAVNVVKNGTTTQREVEVGIMDYTYAEVLSGLEAGEVVSLTGAETN